MQVFQTLSPTRWQRFKWIGRFLLLLLTIAITVLVITLWRGYTPELPRLQSEQFKKALDSSTSLVFNNSKIARQYGGFRKFIDDKKFAKKFRIAPYRRRNGSIPDSSFKSFHAFPAGVRSAFYVSWDPESYFSLQRNIQKLNLIIPEWLFIDPKGDTLTTSIDERGFAVMKAAGIRIMPLLSNADHQVFRGDAVHRIINNPKKKERLINDIIQVLKKNHFAGINIDFEELKEKTDEPLVAFQKELYQKLHARGFLVSQDIIPYDDDYNLQALAAYNDYIFVMAYDQYSQGTDPGPICHQKWIEGAVDEAVKKIPENKIVLCLAAFGYDWNMDNKDSTQPVTYRNALELARECEAKIDFNDDSYNLDFTYTDDDSSAHEVFFTDAATTFNAMRFATEYGLSGVALWRLGSEDSRLWDFYDKDMRKGKIDSFNFRKLETLEAAANAENVDYEGYGEVLDIIGTPTNGKIRPEIDSDEMLISEEDYRSLPSKFVAKKYGGNNTNNKKKLVLTFDDGPDPNYTPRILDILGREHVPAAFFLVGINAENNIPIVKRIYDEGDEIGNHTFTHPNIAKVSERRANLEMESTRLLIECITGHSTIMFRAPYNADFEPQKAEELIPVALARKKNYLDIGESIDPLDWEPGVSADTIFARVIRRKEELTKEDISGNIILLHDAGGDSREATVEALPRIIRYFKDRGYTFTTIADLLGKKRDEMMPPVPKGNGYYLIQLNYFLAEAGYWSGHFLFSLFVVFIILSMGRLLFLSVLASRQQAKEKKQRLAPLTGLPGHPAPLVSIIVPAYNEEVNAVQSLRNLLKADYPRFNIIFVDDGSKDATYREVLSAFGDHPSVKVFTKPNGGKASALNFGIAHTDAEYVVCIDADTKLLPDAISSMMRHFDREEVGAVAGNVKVGNEVNLLTRWQSIEYISSQNFDRKAFSYINAITVIPGAIGAFRKEAIENAGGFTTDTLAEDCDLTVRILRCGYLIENESQAVALTEAPETMKMLFRQRFRWSFGVMQTFWKHRDTLFNEKYRWLGWLAMPNILIFQYIIPSVVPLADIFMVIGLLTGNAARIGWYYLLFTLIDVAVAVLAFSFEKERKSRLLWLIPQRLAWRWILWFVLFKAIRRAIKGELQSWGVLKRTGRVKELAPQTLVGEDV